MKWSLYGLIVVMMAIIALILTSCDSKPPVSSALYDIEEAGLDADRYDGDKVYICTGGSSRRYHRSKHCKGLRSCGGSIERVYQSYAETKGRTPCKMCYK